MLSSAVNCCTNFYSCANEFPGSDRFHQKRCLVLKQFSIRLLRRPQTPAYSLSTAVYMYRKHEDLSRLSAVTVLEELGLQRVQVAHVLNLYGPFACENCHCCCEECLVQSLK